MLGDLSHVDHIYIRTGYTDMRKQLNGLLDNLILMAMPFSFFAGGKQTGSKLFITKEMDSVFCINGSKMAA